MIEMKQSISKNETASQNFASAIQMARDKSRSLYHARIAKEQKQFEEEVAHLKQLIITKMGSNDVSLDQITIEVAGFKESVIKHVLVELKDQGIDVKAIEDEMKDYPIIVKMAINLNTIAAFAEVETEQSTNQHRFFNSEQQYQDRAKENDFGFSKTKLT